MRRVAWSQLKLGMQPPLAIELRVLIELLRVLPKSQAPMRFTVLPSNTLVAGDGSVTVGPVRLGDAGYQERYLAPEVRAGGDGGLAAATYSIGAMLFEAVTGYSFESPVSVQQELFAARAMAKMAGLGARFWEIYLLEAAVTATEGDPERRWPSPSTFADDLERVADQRIASRQALGQWVSKAMTQAPRISDADLQGRREQAVVAEPTCSAQTARASMFSASEWPTGKLDRLAPGTDEVGDRWVVSAKARQAAQSSGAFQDELPTRVMPPSRAGSEPSGAFQEELPTEVMPRRDPAPGMDAVDALLVASRRSGPAGDSAPGGSTPGAPGSFAANPAAADSLEGERKQTWIGHGVNLQQFQPEGAVAAGDATERHQTLMGGFATQVPERPEAPAEPVEPTSAPLAVGASGEPAKASDDRRHQTLRGVSEGEAADEQPWMLVRRSSAPPPPHTLVVAPSQSEELPVGSAVTAHPSKKSRTGWWFAAAAFAVVATGGLLELVGGHVTRSLAVWGAFESEAALGAGGGHVEPSSVARTVHSPPPGGERPPKQPARGESTGENEAPAASATALGEPSGSASEPCPGCEGEGGEAEAKSEQAAEEEAGAAPGPASAAAPSRARPRRVRVPRRSATAAPAPAPPATRDYGI